MSRQMTVAIAGLGSRGRDTYAKAAKMYPDKMKIVAIADIDPEKVIQLFFKVTIPLLTPTIFFVMITSIISGFQVFDVIYMMIGKTNPAYANTQTVVMLFYRQAFDYGYKGYAAAISILIFAVIMLVTVIQMIGQKKWVNYD